MATVTFTFPHDVVISTINTANYTFIPAKGIKGDTGPAPVRGTDYWTAADIAAIDSDVQDMVDDAMQTLVSVSGTTLVFTPPEVT